LTNRHYIGLELEKEYFDIAEARVKYWHGAEGMAGKQNLKRRRNFNLKHGGERTKRRC
jgi:DNA modification methylase